MEKEQKEKLYPLSSFTARPEKKAGPAGLGTHPGLVQRQRLLAQHHALLLHTPVLEPNFDLLVAEV